MNKAAPQHQFKGLTDWVEVFRAGTHTDSKGRSLTFTQKDLDEMVANVSLGAVPSVLGHPKHDDPAWAWTKEGEVKRDGDSLYVKFSDIHPEFQKGVDDGLYRNRSLSVFQDKDAGWRIRHVGWLGAVPPAIDGLKPLDFSADVDAYDFSANWDAGYALSTVASLLRGLRESLIAKDGLDAANAVLPDWSIQAVADAANRVMAAPNDEEDDDAGSPAAFAAPQPTLQPAQDAAPAAETPDLQTLLADQEARLRAEFAAQQGAAQAEVHRLRAEAAQTRVKHLVDGWTRTGHITPAQSTGLSEFMVQLDAVDGSSFEFSAAAGPVSKKPTEWFAEFVSQLKPAVRLGGAAPAGGVGGTGGEATNEPLGAGASAEQIATAAHQYMKEQADKGLTVSLPEAVAHVSVRYGAA